MSFIWHAAQPIRIDCCIFKQLSSLFLSQQVTSDKRDQGPTIHGMILWFPSLLFQWRWRYWPSWVMHVLAILAPPITPIWSKDTIAQPDFDGCLQISSFTPITSVQRTNRVLNLLMEYVVNIKHIGTYNSVVWDERCEICMLGYPNITINYRMDETMDIRNMGI